MNKTNDINDQERIVCALLLKAILGPDCYNVEKNNDNMIRYGLKRQKYICFMIKEIFDSLTVTEKSVLTALLGLDGEKKTYSELAKFQGISEDKVREIEAIAIRKMRRISNIRHLRKIINHTIWDVDKNETNVVRDADSIDYLILSSAAHVPLKRAGVTTITELKNLTVNEIIYINGMVPETVSEIIIKFMEYETATAIKGELH